MSGFRRASTDKINVFEIGDYYLFKHYFDSDEVFELVKVWYNGDKYRYEIPRNKFEKAKNNLAEEGFALLPVHDMTEYIICIRQYTEHPDGIFKESVIHNRKNNYNCFIMKNQKAVEKMENFGGVRFSELNIENPFENMSV